MIFPRSIIEGKITVNKEADELKKDKDDWIEKIDESNDKTMKLIWIIGISFFVSMLVTLSLLHVYGLFPPNRSGNNAIEVQSDESGNS